MDITPLQYVNSYNHNKNGHIKYALHKSNQQAIIIKLKQVKMKERKSTILKLWIFALSSIVATIILMIHIHLGYTNITIEPWIYNTNVVIIWLILVYLVIFLSICSINHVGKKEDDNNLNPQKNNNNEKNLNRDNI